MNRKEILAEMQQWQAVQKALDDQLELLPNTPETLVDAIYYVAEAHTEAVARIVGDTTGALKWWQDPCGYGENPLYAGMGNKMRPIKTLKQLVALIAE